MNPTAKNPIWLKVTTSSYYFIDRSVNGWSLEEIVDDWFDIKSMKRGYHATRDSHKIGSSDRVIEVKLSNQKEFENDRLIKQEVKVNQDGKSNM